MDKTGLLFKMKELSAYMDERAHILNSRIKDQRYCVGKAEIRGRMDGIIEFQSKLDQLISEGNKRE